MNFANRTIWTADNIEILPGIDSECVDLVYLDPPFNSNKDYAAPIGSKAAGAAFKDTWTLSDLDVAAMGRLADTHPSINSVIDAAGQVHGKGMQSYLCMMTDRLVELHRILKPTGSLYLHCDPTASSYLRLALDRIFGNSNFRNEVIWRRTKGRSDAKRFGRVHDVVLFYSKSDKFTWNRQYLPHDPEYVKRAYRNSDARGHWQSSDLTAPGHGRSGGEYFIEWRRVRPRSGRMWNLPMKGGMANWILENNVIPGWLEIEGVRQRLDALDAAGLVHWPKRGVFQG